MVKPSGKSGVAIPVALLVTGLISLGVQHQKIKHTAVEVEKKVDKEVFVEFKESNSKEHESMLRYLEAIHGKELPKD